MPGSVVPLAMFMWGCKFEDKYKGLNMAAWLLASLKIYGGRSRGFMGYTQAANSTESDGPALHHMCSLYIAKCICPHFRMYLSKFIMQELVVQLQGVFFNWSYPYYPVGR